MEPEPNVHPATATAVPASENRDSILVPVVRDITFSDDTVYLTGRAFVGCNFVNCTVIYHGKPNVLRGCHFTGCRWHFNTIVHDRWSWEGLKILVDSIGESMSALREEHFSEIMETQNQKTPEVES